MPPSRSRAVSARRSSLASQGRIEKKTRIRPEVEFLEGRQLLSLMSLASVSRAPAPVASQAVSSSPGRSRLVQAAESVLSRPGSSQQAVPGGVGLSLPGLDARNVSLATDPSLAYSTFLSGSENTYITSIAVDGQGRAYVSGVMTAMDIPGTLDPPDTFGPGGKGQAFLARLNADGSAIDFIKTY